MTDPAQNVTVRTRMFRGNWIAVLMGTLLAIVCVTPCTALDDIKNVDELIRKLGSEDFAKREMAQKELMKREDAVGKIREAMRSPNPEVSRRAKLVDQHLSIRQVSGHIRRMEKITELGYYDLAAEFCLQYGNKMGGEEALAILEGRIGKIWPVSAVNATVVGKKLLKTIEAGQRISLQHVKANRIIARGDLQLFDLASSVVVVDNPGLSATIVGRSGVVSLSDLDLRHRVHKRGQITNCVVICDGDLVVDGISNTLLVSSGKCAFNADVSKLPSCIVIAERNRLVAPSGPLKEGDRDEETRKLTEIPWFFDLKAIGFCAIAKGKDLVATKVKEGSTIAIGGLREGDKILAVDGASVESEHTLRVLIRRAIVSGKGAVTIDRVGKVSVLQIDFRQWPS